MKTNPIVTQICIVVKDVRMVSANWAKVLGMPEAEIVTTFPDGAPILHYTHGQAAEYKDLQVAKYELDNFVLELMQPGETPSPWKAHLDTYGQGVFHFCLLVDDRKIFQQTLSGMDVDLPYHIGYFPGGAYSYVSAKEQLGIELSVNQQGADPALYAAIQAGNAAPLAELKE